MQNLEIITADQQHSLNELKVGIIGNNKSSEIAIANLIGLGIRNINVIGKPNSRIFDDEFLKENNIYQNLFFKDIDLLRDIKSCNEEISLLKDEGYSEFIDTKGNSFFNMLNACLDVDDIRKKYVKLDDFDRSRLDFNLSSLIKFQRRKVNKVLAIGAGGIGNYFALNTVGKDYDVRLVDHDIFEEKNNNRQIFCRPGRKKVEVISDILAPHKIITPVDVKFDESLIRDFDREGYTPDVLVGCVDNIPTRDLMNRYAQERDILYFDGGVGTISGQVTLNSHLSSERMKNNPESCYLKPNPSVVIPNCVIGMYLAECPNFNISRDDSFRFEFDSFVRKRFSLKYDKSKE